MADWSGTARTPGNVLLTAGDVLQTLFLYHHHVCKKTASESANSTVLGIWNKARIPTIYHPHMVAKLKALFEEYSLIKKNKGRESDAHHARQKEFAERAEKLFDIAHKLAESLVKISEDRMFIEDQMSI